MAFPTDTFYGLGADPFNLAAVSEVFRIKRRTADRPLPLLVASIDQAADLTHNPPQLFFTLANKFWPGPLTLVVPASRQIPLKVTANTGKVGLRWPQALLATALIEASARPLTGPAPTFQNCPLAPRRRKWTSRWAISLPLILDGGPTEGLLASTVLDLTGERVRILRTGGISETELKEYLG